MPKATYRVVSIASLFIHASDTWNKWNNITANFSSALCISNTDHRHELISAPSLSLVSRVTSGIEAGSIVSLARDIVGDEEVRRRRGETLCRLSADCERFQLRIDTHDLNMWVWIYICVRSWWMLNDDNIILNRMRNNWIRISVGTKLEILFNINVDGNTQRMGTRKFEMHIYLRNNFSLNILSELCMYSVWVAIKKKFCRC